MGKKGLGAVVGGAAGFAIGGPLGAVALGSAGFSAGAGMEAAEKGVEGAKKQRALARAQAAEILRKAKVNQKVKREEAIKFEGAQVTAFAAGNVAVTSESSLLVLEEAAANFKREIGEINKTAQFNARQVIQGGEALVDQAKANKRAATIGGIAGIASSAATIGMLSSGSPGGGGGGGSSGPTSTPRGPGPKRMLSN